MVQTSDAGGSIGCRGRLTGIPDVFVYRNPVSGIISDPIFRCHAECIDRTWGSKCSKRKKILEEIHGLKHRRHRIVQRKIIIWVVAAAVLLTGIGSGVWWYMDHVRDSRVISRIVKTPDGKGYLEVDGEPFLFGYVENWGVQQTLGDTGGYRYNTKPFDEPLPFEWMENVFEKTKFLGYRTIAPFLRWNDIEPSEKGVYDWTVLDSYVDWAVKYDLRIDIVWMGSIHCGGARLRGENNGWMSWIPDYLQDKDKYFGKGIYSSDIFLAYVPDGGPNDADARFLHQSERDAVAAMMAHLAEYDTTHRVITFQVNNEPNFSPYYRTDKAAILEVLNELGKVVKTSDYSVMTRINLTGSEHDPDLNALEYIDCNGVDPYTYIIDDVVRITSDHEGSHMPHIAENGAYYGNTTSLMVAALASGGFYSTYHLNDHFGKFGFYDGDVDPYVEWELGVVPARRHSGYDIKNLNLSLQKAETLVVTAPAERMAGLNIATDMPMGMSDDFIYFNGREIGMQCEDGSVGLVIEDGGYLYFLSDTSLQVSLMTRAAPLSAETGYFNEKDVWVTEQKLEPVHGEDGIYRTPARSQEILRIRLDPPEAIPSSALYEDAFVTERGDWKFASGTWTYPASGGEDRGLVQSAGEGVSLAMAGDAAWKDYTVRARILPQAGSGGVAGRLDPKGNGYYLLTDGARYELRSRDADGWTPLASGAVQASSEDGSLLLELVFQGDEIHVYIDNVLQGTPVRDGRYASGAIGLATDRGTMRALWIRAEETVLLREDFSSGLEIWTLDKGSWALRSTRTEVLHQPDIKVEASAYAGDASWKDYTVSADFCVISGYGGLIGRMDDKGDLYMLEIRANSVKLVKWMFGQWRTLSTADYAFKRGQWYNASLSFRSSRIEMRIDGVPVGDVVYDASIEQGIVGVRTSFGEMEFDNIRVDGPANHK